MHTHTQIFGHKKELNIAIYNNMNEGIRLSEISQRKTNTPQFHIYVER